MFSIFHNLHFATFSVCRRCTSARARMPFEAVHLSRQFPKKSGWQGSRLSEWWKMTGFPVWEMSSRIFLKAGRFFEKGVEKVRHKNAGEIRFERIEGFKHFVCWCTILVGRQPSLCNSPAFLHIVGSLRVGLGHSACQTCSVTIHGGDTAPTETKGRILSSRWLLDIPPVHRRFCILGRAPILHGSQSPQKRTEGAAGGEAGGQRRAQRSELSLLWRSFDSCSRTTVYFIS